MTIQLSYLYLTIPYCFCKRLSHLIIYLHPCAQGEGSLTWHFCTPPPVCLYKSPRLLCTHLWWTGSLKCSYINHHVHTYTANTILCRFDIWTKARLNMHTHSPYTKTAFIGFVFFLIFVNLRTISMCKGETDKMPKEICLVSLLSLGYF